MKGLERIREILGNVYYLLLEHIGLNLSSDSSGPSLERKRLRMLCPSVFIRGFLFLRAVILFGEGMSGELSSVGGCKKKKMQLFPFGVYTCTQCD